MHPTPESVSPASSNRRGQPFLVRRCAGSGHHFDLHPPVPLQPATRLQLDLLLERPSLDLDAIVGVILSDVGATLQVLRVGALTLADSNRRRGRIDDCVVHLGKRKLRSALAAVFPMAAVRQDEAARQLWRRAQLTANLARTMAGRFPEVDAEQAYVAGLLHEAGRVPAVLGWNAGSIDVGDPVAVGRALVREWGLPVYVEPTLLLVGRDGTSHSSLREIVALAWDLANAIGHGRPLPKRVLGPSSRMRRPQHGKLPPLDPAPGPVRPFRIL